jgi:PAS domain S-box-containing protein
MRITERVIGLATTGRRRLAGFLLAVRPVLEGIGSYGRDAVRIFFAKSLQEKPERDAYLAALLLATTAAGFAAVIGATVRPVAFTLCAVAIAASAARGGFLPGLVATLAAMLVGGFLRLIPVGVGSQLLFGGVGVAVAGIVSQLRLRLRDAEAALESARASVVELTLRDRHGRLLDAALGHLEETDTETAVIALNDRGMITEWRGGAARLYGHSAEEVVGTSVEALSLEGDWSAMLRAASEAGSLRQSAVHRRRDGARLRVELELRPVPAPDLRGFTLTVTNQARRLEWDDYRAAAERAQAALQKAADDTREQLAELENLTDPELDLTGPATVTELLDRLRRTVDADGAALVTAGRIGPRLITACGLQPTGAAPRAEEGSLPIPGRVVLVHNDPARVRQSSALRWPDEVTSLMIVPVVHNAQVWWTVELVSERSRRASDWDVALARIVADRLSAAAAQDRWLAARVS